MTEITIQVSAFADHDRVRALLIECGLPLPVASDPPVRFMVSKDDKKIIGCLGWEEHNSAVLLRSLAVHEDHRGEGVAKQLVETTIAKLKQKGFRQFVILTEIPSFARKLGFSEVDRDTARTFVAGSQQFSSLCCSKAKCMMLQLD